MHHSIIKGALIAAAILLSASPSVAADKQPEASSATADTAKKSAKESKPTEKKAVVVKIKLVDINSAGKKELKTLPGIGETDADRIIAGRPYGSKAHLTTRGIVAREVYENLKRLVIAKQKQAPVAEAGRK